jgi:hypothetical protein
MPENNNTDNINLSKYKPEDYSHLLTVAPKGATTMYGFKESQYAQDFNVPQYGDMSEKIEALQEARAQDQSALDQITNSTLKGIGMAGTTFADIFAGSAAGLINVFGTAAEMATNGEDDQDKGKRLFNAFIDNPVSRGLNDLNETINSDYLVNYRTKREMDNEWYENLGTANFWGESIIKNAGFMVGGAGASKLIGKGLSRMAKIEEARNEFKTLQNAVKAVDAGNDIPPATMKELMGIYKNSPAIYNLKSEELLRDMATAAEKVRVRTVGVQAAASTLGAFGEARLEALGNGNQFKSDLIRQLDEQLQSGSIDQATYDNKLAQIDNQVMSYQNLSFLGNALVLSGSNYMGWRESYLKSYDFAKKNMIGQSERALNGLYQYTAPTAFKGLAKKKGLDALRESQEEQIQFFIDKATSSYVNERYNGGELGTSMFNAIVKGAEEAYGSAEGWENAFAGAFFGALGVPGVRSIVDDVREYKAQTAQESEFVNNVNKAITEGNLNNSKESILTKAFVRDLGLNVEQAEALKNEDRKFYEDLKSKKFFNIANAFIDAGKYEDFIDLINSEVDLDVRELKKKYSILEKEGDESSRRSLFENWEESEIRQYVTDKANKAKGEIKKLRDLKDNLDTLYKSQFIKIKNKEGDNVEYMLKDILAESFYMAEKRDSRIQDLRQELTKAMTDPTLPMTKEAFDFSMIDNLYNSLSGNLLVVNPTPSDILEGKMDLDKVINSLNDYIKRFQASTSDSKVTGLMQDYVNLLTERAMSNLTLAQISKNDFSDLVAAITKKVGEADASKAEKDMAEANAELDNNAKLNLIKTRSKEAGYVDKDGNPYFGTYFTMTDSKGTRTFEIESSNATQIRKDLIAERDGVIAEMNPADVNGIQQITLDYENLIKDAITASTAGGFIRDIENNAYITNAEGKEIRFDDKFAIEYYNKINFLPKEQAEALKLKLRITKSNQAKITALQKLSDDLNRDIVKEVVSIKNELLNRSILEKELEQAKLLAEQVKDNAVDKQFIDDLIKTLTEQLDDCNKAIERIEKSKQAYYRQQEEITQLVNLIKESLEKENFSIRQFVETLESGFVDNIDRVMGLSLTEDLETLADMTNYNEALGNLEALKFSVQDRINALTKKIDFLEALKTKSIGYKNLIVGTKQADMPNWFTNKWKVFYPVSGNNVEKLLKDPKEFARFQYGITKYAERNNITPQQAYDRFLQDYYKVQEELQLKGQYDEQQSIDNEILITKQDLDLLNRQLRAIDNVTEFKRQESFLENLKANIDDIAVTYAIALNRALRAVRIPFSQDSDPKYSQDNPPTNMSSVNLHKGALSSNVYHTTNKVVEYTNPQTFATLYDDEGNPVLNQNNDALRWNSFLEMNPDIKDPYKSAQYTLQAFHYKTDTQMPEGLKEAVAKTLKGKETDNTIVVAMVSTGTGSLIKADLNGKLDSSGGFVFTFLPETDNLFAGTIKQDGSIDKINMKGLLDFYKKHSGHQGPLPFSSITNTKADDTVALSWKKNENRVPLSEIRQEIVNFAIAKHKESINKIIEQLKEGEVYLPIASVTNGILLTKKAITDKKGNKINNYGSVKNTLLYKRGINTSKKEDLDKLTLTIVTKSSQQLKGSSIIVNNAKIGSVIIYNKETQEYFYATQRFVDKDEINLILHIIEKYGSTKDSSLKDLFVNINNAKNNEYYYDKQKGSKLPIFASSNKLSLINNIIYWGVPKTAVASGKGKLSKNNIYVQGGSIHFPDPSNNDIFTSIPISGLRKHSKFSNLVAFLATKRVNIPTSMLQTAAGKGGYYYKPYLNKTTGEISWEQIEGGYLSYLFNGGKGSDPILTTNAVSTPLSTDLKNKADLKNQSESILFASKNIILKTDGDGLITTKDNFGADDPLKRPTQKQKSKKTTSKNTSKKSTSKKSTTKKPAASQEDDSEYDLDDVKEASASYAAKGSPNEALDMTPSQSKEQQENCKTGSSTKKSTKTNRKPTTGNK